MAAIEGERRKRYAKIEIVFTSNTYIKNPGPKDRGTIAGRATIAGRKR